VINQDGVLVGILSMDDILELLVGELNDLVKLTGREREQEILKRNG
jgi:CBS domain containing-hemolysin-like protein